MYHEGGKIHRDFSYGLREAVGRGSRGCAWLDAGQAQGPGTEDTATGMAALLLRYPAEGESSRNCVVVKS